MSSIRCLIMCYKCYNYSILMVKVQKSLNYENLQDDLMKFKQFFTFIVIYMFWRKLLFYYTIVNSVRCYAIKIVIKYFGTTYKDSFKYMNDIDLNVWDTIATILYTGHITLWLKTHNYSNVKLCFKHSGIIEQLIHTFTEENNYCKSWLRARDLNHIVYNNIYQSM